MSQINSRIDQQVVRCFETHYELELPEKYREFLLTTNGGKPTPSAFPIQGFPGNPFGVIQAFFGLNASLRVHDLRAIMGDLVGLIPAGLVPIACTDGDDFVCIDLRKPETPVLFWDRRPFWGTNAWDDQDLYTVAGNFEAFVESLRDY